MLKPQDWEQYNKLVNGEYMTQVDNAGEQAALEGVQLAVLVIENKFTPARLRQKAFEYLSTFGSDLSALFSGETLRILQVMVDFAKEEVQAMEKLENK